jgi:hypothetical protein
MDIDEINRLQAQIDALQAQVAKMRAEAEPERASRRGMLKLAAGAAAGAVAGGLAFGANPASAGVAVPLQMNAANTASTPTRIIRPAAGYSATSNVGLLHLTSDSTQGGNANTLTSMLSIYNGIGPGIVAQSVNSAGAKLDAPVPLKLLDTSNNSATIPTSGYKGQFRVYSGNLYFCVADTNGNNATWRRITGPAAAGAFVAVAPFRAYDSRKTAYTSNGALARNSSRTVSVADAHDSNTGAVSTANVVPAGATAVAYNITATGCTGTNFFAVEPGDSTTYSASAVNFGQGQNIANASVCKLDNSRQLKIFCGDDAGSADFIIDIVGYYL